MGNPMYEPKDPRVARFIRNFVPWGARIHYWKPWNICRSWPLPWPQAFDLWLKHPGRIWTWSHSPRILVIRKFWSQFILVAVGGVYRYNKEGPRSETSNLEARLVGPNCNQWSWLWENPPPRPITLLGEFQNGILCCLSLLSISCFCLIFSWASSVHSQHLCLDMNGKATCFWPLLIYLSQHPRTYHITQLLPWTKIWINISFWLMMKIREKEKEAFVLHTTLLVIK